MEKRRRARINESLAQLKTLILDALRKDSSRHSKLEKADILEMTVRHLQSLRRVQMTAALSADPAVLGKYRAGFSECLAEVNRFLAGCEGVPTDVRSRLLGHLAACLGQLGPSRLSVPPSSAVEAPAPEVHAGRPPLPAFDSPFPLLRPEAAFALPFRRGRTGAPLAGPGAGPQGQSAPWRPWLRPFPLNNKEAPSPGQRVEGEESGLPPPRARVRRPFPFWGQAEPHSSVASFQPSSWRGTKGQ
nr:transcription factor HES-4 [Camelus bactrianus]